MRQYQAVVLLSLAACANDAEPDAARTDTMPVPGVVAPRPDTLRTSMDLRCDNGIDVRLNVYVGSDPRAILAGLDTGLVLRPRVAASGTRYASEDGAVEWWSRGDSATFTFRGSTTTCHEDSDVEF